MPPKPDRASPDGANEERAARVADLVELHDLCARYMLLTSQFVEGRWDEVFTPDGAYNAFGTEYPLDRFPALLAAAPRGQFIGNAPVVELDGDRATGMQHFVFIDQTTHAMRLGWYNDEYVRTAAGWRIRHRKTTFMRKSGAFDSGVEHDPLADTD
jgi:hypothetical protein